MLVFVGVTVLAQFRRPDGQHHRCAAVRPAWPSALALQGTLQNIAAGIIDPGAAAVPRWRISLPPATFRAACREVGLFATELKTFDGIYMLVPNNQPLESRPSPTSRANATRSADLAAGVVLL